MERSAKVLWGVWAAALGALVLNTVVSSLNVLELIENDRAVAHTRLVQKELDDLLSSVKDAETGQRGYVITGNRDYLEPHAQALAAAPGQLAVLDALLSGNAAQLESLEALKGLIAEKFAELQRVIDLRDRGRAKEATDIVSAGHGKRIMDAIRKEVAHMNRTEEVLYVERSGVAQAKYRATTVTNLLGGAIAIAMVAFAFRTVRRELRRRRGAELDLRESNRRLDLSRQVTAETLAQLDAFLQNAPVGIAFLDAHLRYVRINRFLAQANGASIGAHVGRTPKEILPEFSDVLLSDFQRALESGQPLLNRVLEGEAIAPAAPGRHWQISIFPVWDTLQRKIGLGVIAQDITERIGAERALRAREAEFRTLAETVPMMVWTCAADGAVEYFNVRFYDYTGTAPAEVLGDLWPAVFHPDDVDRALARWRHSVGTGADYEIEYRIRGADGRYRWFQGRARPQRDEADRILRWFGTCADIDAAKRLENDLRGSLARFTTLTETLPQIVWTAGPDGRPDFVNRRWTDYTGVIPGDGPGYAAYAEALHPDDLADVLARWRDGVAGDAGAIAGELRLRGRADRGYHWFAAHAIAIRDADCRVIQWVGTLTDIHAQKVQEEHLEALVERRTRELQGLNAALVEEIAERSRAEARERAWAAEVTRSNGELEKFAYVASHDLQEPLRKIQAFGDRLSQKYKAQLDDQGKDYIGRMLHSAGRMRQLINDLLSYSRISSKPRAFARVDLNEVIRGVLADLEIRIQQVGAQVEVGALPAVQADAPQMRQLFQNLIGNALKFHKSDVKPRITVEVGPFGTDAAIPPSDVGGELYANQHMYRIVVADNGIGFDEKYLDRIFEVFQRLHGRDEYEGTGVGLAICHKIVERHGGKISARSRPGEGATFTVALPVSPSEEFDDG